MKKYYLITLILLINGVYNSLVVSQTSNQKPLENVFTLELTFGDKDVPDEYLLVRPMRLAIALNGDIIVADESKLKVFDNSGKPKKIVGRQGQGPGEFGVFPSQNVLENGNICVTDINPRRFSLFSSDYTFINTKNLQNDPLYKNFAQEKGWRNIDITEIYPYSLDEIYIYAQTSVVTGGQISKRVCLMLYQKGGKIETIVESSFEEIIYKNILTVHVSNGDLIQRLLPGKKVVYSETHKDKINENGKWFYIITEHNFNNNQRKMLIKHEYTPVAIPDSVIHPEKQKGYNGDDEVAMARIGEDVIKITRKEYDQKRTELYKELKVYPPIISIFADRDLIFVRTYKFEKNKGWLVDIFDSTTGKYLRSAYFPFIPEIKDGYAYRAVRGNNIFPYIEKYKINPAVYGK